MSKFELDIVHTRARHSSGSKHYGIALLTITTSGGTHSIGRIMRAHGAVGSASRCTKDGFLSAHHACDQFIDLIHKKEKGGYTALEMNRRIITRIKLDSISDIVNLCDDPNGPLRIFFEHTNFTNNAMSEYASSIFGGQIGEIRRDLIHFVESVCKGDATYEDYDAIREMKNKQAKLEAVAVLEAKRQESYGEVWGSW